LSIYIFSVGSRQLAVCRKTGTFCFHLLIHDAVW